MKVQERYLLSPLTPQAEFEALIARGAVIHHYGACSAVATVEREATEEEIAALDSQADGHKS